MNFAQSLLFASIKRPRAVTQENVTELALVNRFT